MQKAIRRSKTENIINKRKKQLEIYDIPVKTPHKLSKMNGLNCGNPDCVYCSNPRKIFKQKTRKEIAFNETQDW